VPSHQRQTKQLGGVEYAKALIVSESVAVCLTASENKARAIVLTGSFSRDEATLREDGNGWRALGDATFLVIHPRPASLNTVRLEAEIESRLASHGIICKTVIVTSTAGALTTMKPHIYAFELRERGLVVWGDRTVLNLMPRFTAAEIPIEDGWWFLCNRMIEQLKTASEADQSSTNEQIQYRIAKLYLSMAACYLLAIGQYEPSYRDRARRLDQLAHSPSPPPSPIRLFNFSRLVTECTDLKLYGYVVGDHLQLPEWDDAASDAEALWRWILGRILNVSPEHSRSELLKRMRERQPLLARSKGWVRAALKYPALFRRSSRHWIRLTCLGSPRYLVYGAASELFFGASERQRFGSEELATIANDLPLNNSEVSGILTWRGLASLIAHNFHMFVESTRT
jgi:hypothetical protein